MKDNNPNATNKNEMSQYFINMKNWYVQKYITPYRDFVYILFIVIISFASMVFTVSIYFKDIKANNFYLTILRKRANGYISRIRPLLSKESANSAVADYIVKQYILIRESYIPEYLLDGSIMGKKLKMMNLSSNKVFNDFVEWINLENPNSPVILYGNSLMVDIEGLRTEFDDYLDTPSNCTAYFTLVERYLDNSIKNRAHWKAQLVFEMSSLDKIIDSGENFRFIVTSYQKMRNSPEDQK